MKFIIASYICLIVLWVWFSIYMVRSHKKLKHYNGGKPITLLDYLKLRDSGLLDEQTLYYVEAPKESEE